jgi:hypothetical protein
MMESWSEFAYQEEYGHLPDQGMTADDLWEMFGDEDPEYVRDVLALTADRNEKGNTP